MMTCSEAALLLLSFEVLLIYAKPQDPVQLMAPAVTGPKLKQCNTTTRATTPPYVQEPYQRTRTTRPAPTYFPKNKKGKPRSTSSSSGDKKESGTADNSLELSADSESSDNSVTAHENKYVPKSTKETHGWRKWHRRCTPCPADQAKKWRDPSIKWLCGGYQRARRSFKSFCMMRLRNCQDGTMFTKIKDGRCKDEGKYNERPHGRHFMYSYDVEISGDSSGKTEVSESEDFESDSTNEFSANNE